ncbi:MAG: hypothetical protein ACYC3B_03095 [Sedimentisphaerales bacterium]
MKHKIYILIITVLGIALLLLILKLVFLLAAKPKVTVNYVTEYNKIARPQNYDPCQNAASYYQKAFDVFVNISDENLRMRCSLGYIDWPTDFNNSEQTVLEQWLASNSQAFEFFKIAANKPYYWVERKGEKLDFIADGNCFAAIMLSELAPFRELTKAILWDAKINAVKGQFQSAFEDILNCYKAGNQKCGSNMLLVDQVNGLEIKKDAAISAIMILNKSETTIENKVLKSFQEALQANIDNDTYVPSIKAEKFFLYDALQRMFLEDGKGNGKLSWRIGWDVVSLCTDFDSKWSSAWRTDAGNLKGRLNCFFGPTRKEIAEQIEKVIAISDQMMTKTPWRIKNEEHDYFQEIKNINNSNFLLENIGKNPKGIFDVYYKTKAQTNALFVVLSILRYKVDIGQFPETLENLVAKGYLYSILQDPYSNSSLAYKITQNGFTLYSVGENFKDDECAPASDDIIFWPPIKALKEKETNQPPQKYSE